MTLTVEFEYEACGKTDSGEPVSRSGRMQLHRKMESDDYIDDGMLYSEALQGAMDDFWTFGVEKADHHGVSDVTISIRNLNDLTNYEVE